MVGAIPIVNLFADIATAIALGIVGAETRVGIYNERGIGATLFVILIKAIPFVSLVPAWTIRVYLAKRQAAA